MRTSFRILAPFVPLLLTACVTSQYSVTPHGYSGVRLYQVFCASCHGLTGHGDGPVQPLIRVGVPDLTRIAERRGGKFPAQEVFEIVEGRSDRPAHGARGMPVWGFEFYADDTSDAVARHRATDTINRLVKYLQTIQQGYYD